MSRVGEGAPDLVLASASPRRLDLLLTIGLQPMVQPADVDESALPGEKPGELVERLAEQKARAIWQSRPDQGSILVVAADTVIDIDGKIFGKPIDDDDSRRMLRTLSGRSHDVVTGLAVIGCKPGETAASVELAAGRTEVWMRNIDADDLDWYIDSGEPNGKAGAYAIQGQGSLLVDRIEGSYQNVVGLPLPLLDDLTRRFGVPLRELGS